MRILIHGINYWPEITGTGRYTGELGSWLARRGHQVTMLCAPPYYPTWRVADDYRGQGWLREWHEGVEILRAPLYVPTRVTGKNRVLHELSFGASCLYWWPHLISRKWEAVMAICPLMQSGLIPSWLAKRHNIPFIIHFQDLQMDMARKLGILRQSALFSFLAAVEQTLLRRATAVTTISKGMSYRLRQKGVPASRLHLLPNWAELESIRPGPRDNPLRRSLGYTSEILVLYAGAVGEKQGLEVLLESARLCRDNPRVRFILAGEGGAKTRLMAQGREQGLEYVLFLPLQSEEEFPLLLAAGDIHLVVQKNEAAELVMPSKLTNILAAGRPFIATALPDTELGRVTRDSQAGVLVPPQDSALLTRAILKLAVEEDSRREMGVKARRYAENWLRRDPILQRFEDLLYSTNKGSGRAGPGRDREVYLGFSPPLVRPMENVVPKDNCSYTII